MENNYSGILIYLQQAGGRIFSGSLELLAKALQLRHEIPDAQPPVYAVTAGPLSEEDLDRPLSGSFAVMTLLPGSISMISARISFMKPSVSAARRSSSSARPSKAACSRLPSGSAAGPVSRQTAQGSASNPDSA